MTSAFSSEQASITATRAVLIFVASSGIGSDQSASGPRDGVGRWLDVRKESINAVFVAMRDESSVILCVGILGTMLKGCSWDRMVVTNTKNLG